MKALWAALLISLLGGAAYRFGTPVLRGYPAPDGTMVFKLTLTRAPGFVAYLHSGGKKELESGA